MFDDTTTWLYTRLKPVSPFLFPFTKEFTGTFAALVCYSRIGMYNMLYAGGINVGMILIVFGFPTLNPYLSTFLFFGPLWLPESKWTIIAKWVVSVVGQCCGSCSAWFFRKYLSDMFSTESLGNSYSYIPLPYSTDSHIWLFDEMFAVLFLLIGLLHLMRSITMPIMTNYVWNPSSSTREDSTQPISVSLIMSIVFLIISITHAFPSADQSLHVTIYMSLSELRKGDVGWYRLFGGVLGTGLALLYYHIYYNSNSIDPESNKPQVDTTQQLKSRSQMDMNLQFFRRRV